MLIKDILNPSPSRIDTLIYNTTNSDPIIYTPAAEHVQKKKRNTLLLDQFISKVSKPPKQPKRSAGNDISHSEKPDKYISIRTGGVTYDSLPTSLLTSKYPLLPSLTNLSVNHSSETSAPSLASSTTSSSSSISPQHHPKFISPRIHPFAVDQTHHMVNFKSAIPHDNLLYNGRSIRNHPIAAYQHIFSCSNAQNKQQQQNVKHKRKESSGVKFCSKFRNRYTVVRKLGEGGFGSVFECIQKDTDITVAVKLITKQKVPISFISIDPSTKARIPFEIYALQLARHPNIIRFIEWFDDSQFFYVVTEIHGKSWSRDEGHPSFDLFECITFHGCLNESVAKRIFTQIIDVVNYLQNYLNICHRDLKDENILVDEYFNVKVIDFGSAAPIPRLEDYKNYFKKLAGTRQYCPPEIIRGEIYRGPEAEVWGLGVLLYSMLTGENPFNAQDLIMSEHPVDECLLQSEHNVYISGRTGNDEPGDNRCKVMLTEQCLNILYRMLEPNPAKRITVAELLRHPWIVGDETN